MRKEKAILFVFRNAEDGLKSNETNQMSNFKRQINLKY